MLTAVALLVAAQAVEPKRDWRAIAISDVSAAYQLFADNHPGMSNPDDPGFPAQLAAARDSAMRIARRTTDWQGYDEALDAFTDGLSDGHAIVVASDEPGKKWGEPRWPGFIPAWRGNHLVVHTAGPASPAPTGSQIQSCDGRPVTQLLRERNRGLWFRPAEAGQWWNVGPYLAFGSYPPAPDQLTHCTFRLADGRLRQTRLPWQPEPAGMRKQFRNAGAGEETPIGLTEPRPGLWLIGLSSFSPDPVGIAAYRKLYDDIDRQRAQLGNARAIILDLRFNGGGSWEWGHDAARHLWGREAVDQRMTHHFRNVRIAWRASQDNVASMSGRIAQIRANGHGDAAIRQQQIADGMGAALRRGDTYYFERAILGTGQSDSNAPTDLATPVYVIVHGGCVSACLDAIDVFKRFDNVKLIGAPTSADTLYMDARRDRLPSDMGGYVMPLKIWMNRPRKSGEIYRPDIPFNDLDWSTTAFLDRIEADLQRRGSR